MIQAFLAIRWKQFIRGMIGIGLFRLLFLLVISGFFIVFVFLQTALLPNSLYVAGAAIVLVASIQQKRNDKFFLKAHFSTYRLVYLIEYLLLLLPVFVFMIFHFQWLALGVLLMGVGITVHLDIRVGTRNRNYKLLQLIPSESFEWKAGIRNTIWIVLPLWTIALGTSFFVGSVPTALFFLGFIPLGFYETGEPHQMLMAYEKAPSPFLAHKIKLDLLLFSAIALPLVLAFMVFHPQLWYIPVAEYFIFISLHVFIILAKYAYYEPNHKSATAQVYVFVGILSTIIPVLLPVVWILSVSFYFKANQNLNTYLHDYH